MNLHQRQRLRQGFIKGLGKSLGKGLEKGLGKVSASGMVLDSFWARA